MKVRSGGSWGGMNRYTRNIPLDVSRSVAFTHNVRENTSSGVYRYSWRHDSVSILCLTYSLVFPCSQLFWRVFVAVDRSSCGNDTAFPRTFVALAPRNLNQFDSDSSKIFATIKVPKQNVNKAISFWNQR